MQGHARNTAQAYVTANALSCSICSDNHKTHECSVLRGMSAADEIQKSKENAYVLSALKHFMDETVKPLIVSNVKVIIIHYYMFLIQWIHNY